MSKRTPAARQGKRLRDALNEAQALAYEVKNLCETTAKAACSDEDGPSDLATWGTMNVAARELQRLATQLDEIRAEHCEPMAEEAA